MTFLLRTILLALGLLATVPAHADFDDGARAFERRDYAAAFAAWRKLAEAGDPRSQFNLGLMLEHGQGAPQSDKEAVRWYRRAANQGYPPAQHRLGQLLAEGRGGASDPVGAYVWLTLAERAAGEGGTARLIALQRDAAARRLTEAQRKEAEAMILTWRPVRE
jgi:TPR repeat protein